MEKTKIVINGQEIEIEIYCTGFNWVAYDPTIDEMLATARTRRELGFKLIEIQK